jgi:hypothetical protein
VALISLPLPPLLRSSFRSLSGANGLPRTGSEDRHRSIPSTCVGVTGVWGAEMGWDRWGIKVIKGGGRGVVGREDILEGDGEFE